jgi:hypothetical protein
MAQFRPFAIENNPVGFSLAGTEIFEHIVVGVDELDYYNNYGGLAWIAGPDEENGIIIAYHDTIIPLHSNSLNPGAQYNIGFLRAANEIEFVKLAQNFVEVIPPTADEAKAQLEQNGYWTSYQRPFWPYGSI